MFKNLLGPDGKLLPKETCSHTNANECMCRCHLDPKGVKHMVPCCENCPFCHRRLPLRYFKVYDY